MKEITKIDMLKFRAKHQAAVIKEYRARIADSERGVSEAKAEMRRINQEISKEQNAIR